MSKRGKIFSVACNDFVTYNEVMFFPGEYLNIVIGPNGTGKSTLVSAIVIGMGGKPELLSRSSDLTDWIKHGCEEAFIEIHVFENDEGDNFIAFQRMFNRNGLDEYKIDEKRYSRKQFLLKVKEYNIQVDNLCQFLPQDRVQDFAKMNPQEMLLNTQMSVCSPEVQEHFQTLCDLRESQLKEGKEASTRQKELEDLIARNEALRPQIENMRVRDDMIKDLEIGKKKLAWLDYEKWNKQLVEHTNDLNQAQMKLNIADKKLEPVRKQAEIIMNTKKKMETKIATDSEKGQKLNTELNKQHDQLDRLSQEMISARAQLRQAIQHARERKNDIDQAKKILIALKQDLAESASRQQSVEEIQAKINALTAKFHEYSEKKVKLGQQRGDLQDQLRNIRHNMESVKSRIANMENREKQKMQALNNKDDNAARAAKWLENNRHIFRGHVYNPIALEINLLDQKYAKFIETCVGMRDLVAFGFEDPEDLELFLHETRQNQKLQVNAFHAESNDQVTYQPTHSIDQMRKFGFKQYLIDIIQGPAPILNYLCKLYRIHETPICEDKTGTMIDQLPREIRLFFTDTQRFVINISRYTGAVSSMATRLQPKNLLNCGVDPEIIMSQLNRLQELTRESDHKRNALGQIDDSIKQLEDQISNVNSEKRAITNSGNELKNFAEKVKRQEQKIKELQNNVIDIDSERAKFKNRAKQIIENIIRVHEQINNKIKLYADSCFSVDTERQKLQIFLNNNSEIDRQIHILHEEVTRARRLVTTIEQHVSNSRAEQKKREKEALTLTNNKNPKDKNFPFKEQFKKFPNEYDQLNTNLTELQARIDLIGTQNKNVVEEYEQRAHKIKEVESKIRNSKNRDQEVQNKIDDLHSKWYPEITRVVKVINDNFSHFMSSMGLAGEVEMSRKAPHDYLEYGITIRVKYRASEQMAILDRTYQSGGERAVAIAVYTLSLQHISHVPFRCVDEINQGMDPKNERKIFEMLVNETCKIGNSQYFFITPKLLPNLHYNELMNVFIVHNGKFIDDPYVFVKKSLA
uniref:Structural maintenance of chromosomes protein 5 n=1 Tax=Culicoides sonorensis TaxID=179676 RepID=A0A336MNE2_CULSO